MNRVFVEGEAATRDYMKTYFLIGGLAALLPSCTKSAAVMPTIKRHWRGWRAKRAPTVLIFFPPSAVSGFSFDSGGAVCAVQTDKGEIACDEGRYRPSVRGCGSCG